MKLDELHDQLLNELAQMLQLLKSVDETEWAARVETWKNQVDMGNATALEQLGRLKRGKGSFADLTIGQLNGHRIEPAAEDGINQLLQAKAARAQELAQAILGML